VEDYTNQTQVETCWLGDENVALPDINTEDATVVSTYNAWIKSLVSTYGFDAIRIDTVKHVRQNFWPDFVSSAGVHAVGEVLDGDPAYIAAYQNNSMNSVFNYPLYYAIDSAFNSTTASLSNVVSALSSNRQQFKDVRGIPLHSIRGTVLITRLDRSLCSATLYPTTTTHDSNHMYQTSR
jgi:alpha-amylase